MMGVRDGRALFGSDIDPARARNGELGPGEGSCSTGASCTKSVLRGVSGIPRGGPVEGAESGTAGSEGSEGNAGPGERGVAVMGRGDCANATKA